MRYRLSAVGCTDQPDLITYAYRVNALLHSPFFSLSLASMARANSNLFAYGIVLLMANISASSVSPTHSRSGKG
jgi:hypothetical protein